MSSKCNYAIFLLLLTRRKGVFSTRPLAPLAAAPRLSTRFRPTPRPRRLSRGTMSTSRPQHHNLQSHHSSQQQQQQSQQPWQPQHRWQRQLRVRSHKEGVRLQNLPRLQNLQPITPLPPPVTSTPSLKPRLPLPLQSRRAIPTRAQVCALGTTLHLSVAGSQSISPAAAAGTAERRERAYKRALQLSARNLLRLHP